MTADAILLRPLGPGLARRVALLLAALFAAALLLAWLASRALLADRLVAVPPAPAAAAAARPAHSMLPPAGLLAFRPALVDGQVDAAHLLDPVTARQLADWSALLQAHPDSRVTLILSTAGSSDLPGQRRVGAALVRLLAGMALNPHRIRLVLAPADAALSPGEYRLAIETAAP